MREGAEETLSVSAVSIAEWGAGTGTGQVAQGRTGSTAQKGKNFGPNFQNGRGMGQNNRLSDRGPGAECGGITQIL